MSHSQQYTSRSRALARSLNNGHFSLVYFACIRPIYTSINCTVCRKQKRKSNNKREREIERRRAREFAAQNFRSCHWPLYTAHTKTNAIDDVCLRLTYIKQVLLNTRSRFFTFAQATKTDKKKKKKKKVKVHGHGHIIRKTAFYFNETTK